MSLQVILYIALGVLALFVLIGEFFCLYSMSCRFKRGIIYKTRNRLYESQDVDWFRKHAVETERENSLGLRQTGYIFEHEEPSEYWMVLVHGYSSQALNMSNYIKGFYNLGYNVLCFDLMGMGKSEGKFVGMGGVDAEDLLLWIQALNEARPGIKIGLMGASMGASTVMKSLELPLPENVEFFIEDSGYTNLYDQVRYQLRTIYHMDFAPVVYFSRLMVKLNYGYDLKEIDLEPILRETELPGLVLHGLEDDFVPPCFAERAYENLTHDKFIHCFEGCRHIRAEHWRREEYWETVTAFLEKYSGLYKA